MKNKTCKKMLMSVIFFATLTGCGNNATESETESAKPTETANADFDKTKNITCYTRDTTSGTRDGFFTKIGLEKKGQQRWLGHKHCRNHIQRKYDPVHQER